MCSPGSWEVQCPPHLEPLSAFRTTQPLPQSVLQSAPSSRRSAAAPCNKHHNNHPEAVQAGFWKAPNPACITVINKIQIKHHFFFFKNHLRICKLLSQGFGMSGMGKDELLYFFFPERFFYADFCYRITSWRNNAWQELIKDCSTNRCRAHWGKFVTGTAFLCLHGQKLGLTVPLISGFGSVWTHHHSVLPFSTFFSIVATVSLFKPSEHPHPDSHCYAVLSNAKFVENVWDSFMSFISKVVRWQSIQWSCAEAESWLPVLVLMQAQCWW